MCPCSDLHPRSGSHGGVCANSVCGISRGKKCVRFTYTCVRYTVCALTVCAAFHAVRNVCGLHTRVCGIQCVR